MSSYYFNTGIEGKNTIEARTAYNRDAGGYVLTFQVGDRDIPGFFGWHIDADYFNFYQRPQMHLLVPAGRRSEKKAQEADALAAANILDYVRDFAAKAEALGAPHMTITAAA